MSDKFLNPAQLEHLADVIAQAEAKTSGEIRLIIARRSSRGGHVGLTVWLILVIAVGAMLPLHLYWWLLPALMLVSLLVAWPLSHLGPIQRAFIPRADRSHAVWSRAELEFHREGLSQTSQRTGILLFLSLLERKAVVLADKGIAEKLAQSTWDDVVRTIVSGSGDWSQRLEQAIRLCGRHLEEQFPASSDKQNELSNSVLVKD